MQQKIEELEKRLNSQNIDTINSNPVPAEEGNSDDYTKGLKISPPETYNGQRNNSVIEAWIWQLENYFKFNNIKTENLKIDYNVSLLRSSALVWYRSVREPPNTFSGFIKLIKEQFIPINYEVVAREKLAKLQQEKGIGNYNREFLDIMIPCKDVSDAEALDRYIRGLKPWTRRELQLREVTDIQSAMRMAEKVTMIDLNNSNENSNKTQDSKGNNKKVFNKFNEFIVRN